MCGEGVFIRYRLAGGRTPVRTKALSKHWRPHVLQALSKAKWQWPVLHKRVTIAYQGHLVFKANQNIDGFTVAIAGVNHRRNF